MLSNVSGGGGGGDSAVVRVTYTGKVNPVCNDHLYNKIHYLWLIQ